MIKKRNAIIMILVSIILTAVITGTFALTLNIKSGDKVVVNKTNYDRLVEMEKQYAKLTSLERTIEKNFYKDVDTSKYSDNIIKGMFKSLDDPYSVYFTADEFKSFNEKTTGEYAGIGIYIDIDENGYIKVISPIEDTPAERAGLVSGDLIIKVDDLEVSEENFDQAIDIMKGKPGTDVNITVVRGESTPFVITVTREIIKVKAVKSEVKEDNIGYLRITSFSDDSYEEFDDHIKTLLAKDVKGLIIDLRNNPGGSLYAVNKIADQLLGTQTIVTLENRAGKIEEYKSDSKKVDLPIAVLINGGSASASEILTGAIKDSKSGTIIGTQTFGKGLVQSVVDLPDGSGFKLTTAEYFTPSGANINKIGIAPDILLEFDGNQDGDNQLDKAMEVIREKMK